MCLSATYEVIEFVCALKLFISQTKLSVKQVSVHIYTLSIVPLFIFLFSTHTLMHSI